MRIRFAVKDDSGVPLPVGPIRVSTQDSVEEVLTRILRWLQEGKRGLAGMWPHGVLLLINGQPLQRTAELFEAKAGQIRVMAAPGPPPAPSSGRGDRNGDHPAGVPVPMAQEEDVRVPTVIQQEVPVPVTQEEIDHVPAIAH